MCVSYQLILPLIGKDTIDYFQNLKIELTKIDSFNEVIYPGRYSYIVYKNTTSNKLEKFHFGLIPNFAKEKSIYKNLFNSRSETIQEKYSFKNSFSKRRCIIPCTGFFETNKKNKKKYIIKNSNNSIISLAGIWDVWKKNEEVLYSFSIITCPANSLISKIHDRMPVILENSSLPTWLNIKAPISNIQSMLKTSESKLYTMEVA
ncbi:MAG: SOS response-associated peptidase [Leptospiraceae bacterium]|nr:SOS response-associated peptidase [Leptospiraceae bacterium]MCK6380519.1 SOS response-associated peptidase [Leptospiraceae bacterium]NUM41051.1 SOS response-associated peptidase [Leptospiraceae bacterium]